MDESRRQCSRRRLLAVAGAVGLAGCSSSEGDRPETGRPDTETTTVDPPESRVATTGTVSRTERPASVADRYDLTVAHDTPASDGEWAAPTDAPPELQAEVLIENLEIPWDLSFAGDGTLFITERVGRLRAFDGETARVVARPGDVIDAEAVDPGEDHEGWFVEGGEGGLLGVAAHPGYPDPPVVYAYYTVNPGGGKQNRVAAVDTSADDPSATVTPIVEGIPADGIHNGGRIAFGPENYLWVTCGDAGNREAAQDTATLHGTVLKLTPTGEPAPDTPDLEPVADDRIYTYGHRNPQGIVWLPDGTPVINEHGDGGQDEVNRLVAGANYGWPETRFREEYADAPEIQRPLASSGRDTWAPSGSVFYTGDAVPGMENRMVIGGLWSQQLTVATFTPPGGSPTPVEDGTRHDGEWSDDAYTATTHARLSGDLGRLRHVEQGPDGNLYAITSNRDGRAEEFPVEGDDVLVRLTTA